MPGTAGATSIALDAGPTGRLWLAWVDGSTEVKAARSAPAGFKFGGVRQLDMPVKGGTSYHVAVEASLGEASVVVNDGTNLYHRQVQPGDRAERLTEEVGRRQGVQGEGQGDRRGHRDRRRRGCGGGEPPLTKSNGTCVLKFPAHKPGKIKLKATKSGYSPAIFTVKVKA